MQNPGFVVTNTQRYFTQITIYQLICYYRTVNVVMVEHYNDVIMSSMASQITSLTIVYSIHSRADQRKHQSSASLAFVWGIHRSPVNSPHKGPVTRKMFPFDDVIMNVGWQWMEYTDTAVLVNYLAATAANGVMFMKRSEEMALTAGWLVWLGRIFCHAWDQLMPSFRHELISYVFFVKCSQCIKQIQCGSVITRSIFSRNLTIGTP